MEFVFNVLTINDIESIHENALKVLKQTGIKLFNDELACCLRGKGYDVNKENIIRFDAAYVERALKASNKNIILSDMSGNKTKLEKGRTMPAVYANAVKIYDHAIRKTRESNAKDLDLCLKLAESIPEIKIVCPVCLPGDLPVEDQQKASILKVMSLSTKPVLCSPLNEKDARMWIDSVEMTYPKSQVGVNLPLIMTVSPTSPLKIDNETCEIIKLAALRNAVLLVSSCPMAGATSPFTMAGTTVLTHAEFLGILTISFAFSDHPSVIYGGSAAPMNLKNGTLCYGLAERNTMLCANIDIADHFGLPHFSAAGSVNSASPDIETGMSKALSWTTRLMKGSMLGIWFGSLLNGTAVSAEQIIIDSELYKMVSSMLKGMRVDEESMAVDAITRVGYDGDYMTDESTFEWIRSDQYYFSPIINYTGDVNVNSLDLANGIVKKILSEYAEAVPGDKVDQLKKYLADI